MRQQLLYKLDMREENKQTQKTCTLLLLYMLRKEPAHNSFYQFIISLIIFYVN